MEKPNLSAKVLERLSHRSVVTAESLTGGGIGAALTAVPGASTVFKGGVISYTDQVKHEVLNVPQSVLNQHGAVSMETAEAMASGVRRLMKADVAVSVTGLAGPAGDDFGHPVGTVFVGYCDETRLFAREYRFDGDREEIRRHTVCAALELILEMN